VFGRVACAGSRCGVLPAVLLEHSTTSEGDSKSTEQLDPKIRQRASFP
jgi:hypothetical protein